MVLRYQRSDAAARTLGISILPFGVREPEDIDRAFEGTAGDKPDAVLVIAEALTVPTVAASTISLPRTACPCFMTKTVSSYATAV
jgi:hypothetical protein